MKVWKIVLSTLVIFIAGVITGGVLVTRGVLLYRGLMGFQNHPRNGAFVDGGGAGRSNGNVNSDLNPPSNRGNKDAVGLLQTINPWQARTRELVRRMDRELELTPEQHKHIETLINTSQERTRDLWRPVAPAMNKEFQILRKEIRDQLTPEQRDKFDQINKPRQNQIEKRRQFLDGDSPNPDVPFRPSDGPNDKPAGSN
jgi:hypothetical protein